MIGQKDTNIFWPQSEARTIATVWNWCDNTISPGTPCPGLKGTKTPWISEDEGNKRDPSIVSTMTICSSIGRGRGILKNGIFGQSRQVSQCDFDQSLILHKIFIISIIMIMIIIIIIILIFNSVAFNVRSEPISK